MKYRRTKKEVDALVKDLEERAENLAEFYLGTSLGLPVTVFTGIGYAGCIVYDIEGRPVMRLARHVLVNESMRYIMDLFHHELAHAFTPEDTQHGWGWLEMYMELEPTSPNNWSPSCKLHFVCEDWRYIGKCSCGRERRRDRRPRADWTCSQCHEAIEYERNPDFNPYGVDAPR